MISQIIKRDGSIEPFNAEKIILAITKAGKATGQFDRAVAEELYQQEIFPILAEKRTTLNIEEIQDLVEKALFNTGFQETHKAFVLYRQSRKQEREKKKVAVDVQSSIDEYVTQSDWRVRANANQGYSLGGMILNVAGKVTANYWLSYVYPPEVGNAHRNGDFHIHDLDMLTGYCCGHSLRALLNEGFNGVPNKVESNPPKHLSSAMLQMVNFLGSLQNEWSGAQAFSSFDTYLAPFVRVDKLTYSEVKQEMQEFVFSMNAPSRWGCVPITTEVLTVDGWKGHYSLKETDKVYSFNEKGELCLSNVNRIIHKKNSNGKLYSFKNEHYGYEQLVTTNHRVICAKTVNLDSLDVSDWHIRLAEDIAASDKRGKLPVAFTGFAGDFSSFKNTDTEIKLAAAFYCDGSFDFRNDSIHKVVYYKSPLRQKPEWFENLCKEYGLQYSVADKSTEMSEHVLHYTFYGDSARKIVNLVGDKNKIASRFLNMPKAQSELFLYTWACHDGEEEKMCLQFDTTTVAKQLQHIAVNAGFTSYIKQKNASRYVKIRRVASVNIKEVEEVVYSGDVWCPSVTFGTVIFRDRFGNVFISGNTQTPFTNLTFDIHCPDDLRDQHPLIGGEEVDFTYGDLQKEMDMLNKAYIEVMTEGDAKGRVFTFPIPTYNITKDFDWDSPNSDLLFEMTAKYGLPYFQNFTNSDLDPHMIRSMCPMFGDTLVVYKLNKEDAESKVSKVRELVGKEIWVKYKDEWKLSCGNKSFKQDCYEIVDEKATHYLGENHLQPVIRDGKEITVSVKDLLLTDKLIYTDGEKKILKMTNIGVSDDLYCVETLGETDNHLFELQDGLITHNCRLRLDLTELLRRGNGLFGSAEQVGSVGVVTINCARLGYLFKDDKEGLYKRLDYLLELAKNSLELRRKTISRLLKDGLYPYTKRYLGSYRNFFSTIGVNGINEMIRNFTDDTDDITTERGHKMAVELLEHIREREVEFQKETGNLYNLEASPAEGACYRFAKEDRKRFPDIIQAGTESNPYYTNSSQLPVNYTDDPFEALAKQEELQCLYTGGTSCHLYMNERISTAEMCKRIVRKALTQFRLPYITITPTFSICPKHGYIAGEHKFCPKCDAELIAKKRHEKCCCC